MKAICLLKGFINQSQKNERAFVQFYSSVVQTAEKRKIGLPKIPRYRRASSRLDKGSLSHKYTTPEKFIRVQYFEELHILVMELEDRFEQKEFVLSLEELLMRAANGQEFCNQIKEVNESVYKKVLILATSNPVTHFATDNKIIFTKC